MAIKPVHRITIDEIRERQRVAEVEDLNRRNELARLMPFSLDRHQPFTDVELHRLFGIDSGRMLKAREQAELPFRVGLNGAHEYAPLDVAEWLDVYRIPTDADPLAEVERRIAAMRAEHPGWGRVWCLRVLASTHRELAMRRFDALAATSPFPRSAWFGASQLPRLIGPELGARLEEQIKRGRFRETQSDGSVQGVTILRWLDQIGQLESFLKGARQHV